MKKDDQCIYYGGFPSSPSHGAIWVDLRDWNVYWYNAELPGWLYMDALIRRMYLVPGI